MYSYKIKEVKTLDEAMKKAKNIFFIEKNKYFILDHQDEASRKFDEDEK